MLIVVNEWQFLEIIEDRIKHWKDNNIIVNLYKEMYNDRFESGYYQEDEPFDLNAIVDNDIINYTNTISKKDYPEDFQLLLESYENDKMDVSNISFNNISANQIEAYDSYNEIFLVSFYG